MKKDDENTKRDRFTFFRSYQEVIDKCGKDDQLKIYRSIAKFALDGEEPQFDNTTLEMMWILIRPILRKSEVRSDSGRTGGKNGKGVSRNKGNKNAEKHKQINSKTKAKQKQINSDMDNGYMDNGYIDNVSIETKETDTKKDGLSLPLSPSPYYQKFIDWLKKNCPNILTMALPTEAEYKKLLEKVRPKSKLANLLLAMDNRKDTAKKNNSIYRTALNWWNRDHKTE